MASRSLASKPRHSSHCSLSSALPSSHSSEPPRAPLTYQSISPSRGDSRGNSQAVAGAIRALQDKIRLLERENRAISVEFTEKLTIEKRSWEERSRIALSEHFQKEGTAGKRVAELEDELHQQRLKGINLEEYVKSVTAQMENRQENSDFEREKAGKREKALENRVETVEKQLEQKKKEVELIELNLLHLEMEKRRLETENSDLVSEIHRLKGEIDRQKRSETTEKSALISKISENEQIFADFHSKITNFEREIQHLTELNRTKDQQIQFFREEVESLKRAHAISESARTTLSLENEKARKLIYDLSLTHETLFRDGEKRRKIRDFPAKSPKSASKQPQKHTEKPGKLPDAISSQASTIEREISLLNEAYNQVLSKAESMELNNLRGELNEIAGRMEAKWKALEELKRRQGDR